MGFSEGFQALMEAFPRLYRATDYNMTIGQRFCVRGALALAFDGDAFNAGLVGDRFASANSIMVAYDLPYKGDEEEWLEDAARENDDGHFDKAWEYAAKAIGEWED